MNLLKEWKRRQKERTDKLKQEEMEDIVNVSIVDNKLMIVIKNFRSFIALDPSMFKETNIEAIVQKIRDDNFPKLKV